MEELITQKSLGLLSLLVVVLLATAVVPVMAWIPEEAEDTDVGDWTWAWAYVEGRWDPYWQCYIQHSHLHDSGTPGTQGYCDWWIQQNIDLHWYDERDLLVAVASLTDTYPYNQFWDAHAYAKI